MKKLNFTLFLLLAFLIHGYTSAQGLKFGIGGGLTSISNSNSGYTTNAGYHIGAKLKLEIPLVPITPVLFVTYHVLNGSYSYQGNYNGSVNNTQKILSAGVGVEYKLIPGPISPYIAVDLGFNNIGEVKNDPFPSGFIYPGYAPLPSGSRTGIDIGAGAEISIPFFITFDISAKYNMLNAFGKSNGEGSINALILNASILF
jgi:hypothetical protein